MAITIGSLLVDLRASTAAFAKDLSKAEQLSFNTAKQIERSWNIIGTAITGAASAAAGALVVGIEKTVEWEVHIGHLAQSAGTSTEAMSGLAFASKMMGIEIDQVALALERFDKQLLQAQLGNKKAAQNMSLLGIDPKQIKTSDDALLLLAEHFAELPDGVVKSGEAMMAFGKAGAAMIPILNLGSKGIQDFLDQAKRMGVVITKEQFEQAEKFEQNMKRMEEALHGLWVEITNKTLPAINSATAAISEMAKDKGWGTAILQFFSQGGAAAEAYMKHGDDLIATQNKMAKGVKELTAAEAERQRLLTEHAKAVKSLEDSVKSIVTTYQTEIATMGMTNLQVTEYKLRADAAKLGIQGWVAGELKLIEALDRRKKFLEQLAVLDNSRIDAEKKNFLADKLAIDLEDLDVMKKQLDVAMQMSFAPQSTFTPDPKATDAFTASINEQIHTLEHQIATFGLSAEAIARYDLAALDSSELAAEQIAGFKELQDQLDAMKKHADAVAAAWEQFGQVADRSLNDLIFSGKKFTDVLVDITKQLGEMFLKWALFGFGEKNASGGGGIFGALFSGLSSIFGGGKAAGGPVSPGHSYTVGENGPETFYPAVSGSIVPNGGSGGKAQIIYQIDARGSSITEEQFRRSLEEFEKRAVARSVHTVRELSLRS